MKNKPRNNPENIIERTRAAGAYLNMTRNRNGDVDKDMELAAFMDIFHPEVKGKRLRNILKR